MDHPLEAPPLLPAGPGRPRSRGDHQGSRDRLVLVLLHRARGCSTGFLRLASHLPPWCSSHRTDRGWRGLWWTSSAGGRGGGGTGGPASGAAGTGGGSGKGPAPAPALPLEVRPSHPSTTHGQGASRCGRSRVREGALAHSSRRPCSPVPLPCSHHPRLHPLSPASHPPGLGGGTRPHWRNPSAPWG